MKVLLATDGSDDAVEAAAQAIALLSSPDHLIVMSVTETPAAATSGLESGFAGGMASPVEIDLAWSTAEEETASAIERTVAALGSAQQVETVAEIGDPAATICRVASERDVDVVVVGSRGRGAIRRAVLGSVSTHVVNHAPCPVLVIRAGTAS